MSLLKAVILGLVQGLTEFLPVSSSAHLVFVQHLLGLREPMVVFDVVLHLGTLLALLIYFWRDLIALIHDVFRPGPNTRIAFGLVIASIPTALIGFAFQDWFKSLFGSLQAVGFALLGTSAILWFTRDAQAGRREIGKAKLFDFLAIGTLQGIAIIPGISRSGSTLAAGLLRGLKREDAFRFSFLLAIPAIIGAAILELRHGVALIEMRHPAYAAGLITAAVSGFFALRLLANIVKKGKLHEFAKYTLAFGIIVLLASRRLE